MLIIGLISCGDATKKKHDSGEVQIQWVDDFVDDFSFIDNWSYPEGIYRNEFGQLVCDGFCPPEVENMRDEDGRIFTDSIDSYYNLVDTTHLFHSIQSEAETYEWAGTDFIIVEKINKDTVDCFTLKNASTHSSLNLIIAGSTVSPTIVLESLTSLEPKIYDCSGGEMLIDKNLWEKGILKASFNFTFIDNEKPEYKMLWEGLIYEKIDDTFIADIDPFSKTAEEWKNLGYKEENRGNYKKAIKYYEKAIEADSDYFDAYLLLGAVYSENKTGKEKAIEYYNKAISINDTNSKAFFSLGVVYGNDNDYDKAIELFKKGLSLNPNLPVANYYIGHLYLHKEIYPYAILYLKRAAQMGDTLAQQDLIDFKVSWEDTYTKPDYEKIKRNIENRNSNFYYSKLWNRYQQGDSTMTSEECHHLYYGYVFNKNYTPYKYLRMTKSTEDLLKKEETTTAEWEEIAALLKESIRVEPFNCIYLYELAVAYIKLNKLDEARKSANKGQCVLNALYTTGDGLSRETAIHVISVSNEYDYLMYVYEQHSVKSQAYVQGDYDVLYLNPNSYGIEELWFDVSSPLKKLNQSFEL